MPTDPLARWLELTAKLTDDEREHLLDQFAEVAAEQDVARSRVPEPA